jgi:hypothetical protein
MIKTQFYNQAVRLIRMISSLKSKEQRYPNQMKSKWGSLRILKTKMKHHQYLRIWIWSRITLKWNMEESLRHKRSKYWVIPDLSRNNLNLNKLKLFRICPRNRACNLWRSLAKEWWMLSKETISNKSRNFYIKVKYNKFNPTLKLSSTTICLYMTDLMGIWSMIPPFGTLYTLLYIIRDWKSLSYW